MMSTLNQQKRSTLFQHIIVPLDQSSLAEQALPVAARIARASGGSLRLIHVVHIALDYAWQYGQDAERICTNMVESSCNKAEIYLKRIARREDLRGLQVETEVLRGQPAQAILDASRAHKADLIVICNHDYTGVERWLPDAVASKLVHESSIPIFFFHADGPLTHRHTNDEPVRVMVPLDGSSLAEEVLDPAAMLSRVLSPSQQQALHLASVLPIDEEERQPLFKQRLAIEQAQLYLSILEHRLLQREDVDVEPSITTSVSINHDIAHTIVELAETGNGAVQAHGSTQCDVIAMTTRDRSASARWVMGSIAERVLTTTSLPVLLIHPHQEQVHLDEAGSISSVIWM